MPDTETYFGGLLVLERETREERIARQEVNEDNLNCASQEFEKHALTDESLARKALKSENNCWDEFVSLQVRPLEYNVVLAGKKRFRLPI